MKQWHGEYGEAIEMLLYPSDEFGGQELPSEQVAPFVKGKGLPTDGGGCTLMSKTKVNGPTADPVWKMVKQHFPGDIGWNFFGIFLFDAKGKPVARFDANSLDAVDKKLKKLVQEAKQEL